MLRDGSGELDLVTASWYAEFRYRRLFGLTHDQYLDEPGDVIQWMVRIDDLVRVVEKAKSKEATR